MKLVLGEESQSVVVRLQKRVTLPHFTLPLPQGIQSPHYTIPANQRLYLTHLILFTLQLRSWASVKKKKKKSSVLGFCQKEKKKFFGLGLNGQRTFSIGPLCILFNSFLFILCRAFVASALYMQLDRT